MQTICAPLGWLMKISYDLTGNYGLAIIIFTLLTDGKEEEARTGGALL